MKRSYLILVLFFLAGLVFADESNPVPETTKGLGYKLLDDGTYSVGIGALNIGKADERDSEGINLVIPATHLGKAVTVIEPESFAGKKVFSLVLSDSLVTIGEGAFENCSLLSGKVIIPSSVKSIGESAFRNCQSLSDLTLSEGVESIGNNAFEFCAIENLTIPASVTTIGEKAFITCQNLKTVIFNGTTIIGDSVFEMCDRFSSVTFTEKVVFGKMSFKHCGLKEVIIPEGVETIPELTFWENYYLTKLVLPSTIQQINISSFTLCSIEEVSILSENAPKVIPLSREGLSTVDMEGQKPIKSLFDTECLKKILLPSASMEKFAASSDWSLYADWFVAIQQEITVE